jgi:hydrogenase expression/formation protein HypE
MQLECPIPLQDYDAVTLGHGGGGKLAQRLIEQLLLPALDNDILRELADGAIVPWEGDRVAISTDSYVVRPPFFPGGDIGLLAVHGTANDLAMCGARPRFLSLAFILEEGFPLEDLWRLLLSIRQAADALGVRVVTGDTKVVERGKGDGIFINTTGIGTVREGAELSPRRVAPGDRILLSGSIGEHGMAVMSVREGLRFEGDLASDTAALWPLVDRVLGVGGPAVHALRDATRGGVASVLNEIAGGARAGMVLEETAIPVRAPVRAACEMLGLDPLYVANEGRFVCFAAPESAAAVLEAMRADPLGQGAVEIGEVVAEHPGVVRMRSGFGGSRVVDMMSGEQLPRIC